MRDEWKFNYTGLFLSVSGIILVAVCALIAYRTLDPDNPLEEAAVASTLPVTATATYVPTTTTIPGTTTTTTAAVPAVDQALLAAVNELLATSDTKLAAYEAAKAADPYDLVTTKQLAGELAVLWNAAPPQAVAGVPWAAQYEAARSQVGPLFLAVYDLIQQPRDFSNIDDAEAAVEAQAIPLIEALKQAIGP